MSDEIDQAIAIKCATHVVPMQLEHDGLGHVVVEASVDCYGNVVFRGADGRFVMVDADHWGKIDKLVRRAKKAGFRSP